MSDAVREMQDQGHISQKNMVYLIVDQPKADQFHLLPKIHIAGNPGRTIVSAIGHPTNMVYLIVDQPKAGQFHLLPKIHKAGNPGRPHRLCQLPPNK